MISRGRYGLQFMAEMDFNDPHAAPLRAKLCSVASSLKFLAGR